LQICIVLASSLEPRVDSWVHEALVFDPKRRTEVWRFASYVFLHQGAAHAALNIVIQLVLATPLEREQKWTRTALVYFGGGLAGGYSRILHMLFLFLALCGRLKSRANTSKGRRG